MLLCYVYIYKVMAVVWYIFVASVLVQLWYIVYYFARLAAYSPEPMHTSKQAVSVVICARNEAENLQQYLPKVLQQKYLDLEVVVIDDHSTDNTWQVLTDLSGRYPHLKILQAQHSIVGGNKKQALQQAIAAANHNILLLTDADCYPTTEYWISEMASSYEPETEIVLGYGAYEAEPTFLNKLIQYETFLTAMQYGSFALAGRPYMGVGRNLSYSKSVYEKSNALQQHAELLSGDDDLLVNEMTNEVNTKLNFGPNAFTVSKAKQSWKAWWHQKRRHSSAGHKYKLVDRLLLGGFLVTQILIYFTVSLLLIYDTMILWAATLFLIRYVAQLIVYRQIMKHLKVAGLLVWMPILDFIISVFFTSLGLLSVIKVKEWKKDLPLQVEHKKI